jgi:predicted membrane protein
MPIKYEVEITDITVCFYCKKDGLTENDQYCPDCGFPQRGSLQEQKSFLCDSDNREIEMGQQKLTLGFARYILFFIAVVNLVFGIIGVSYTTNEINYVPELITAVIFMFLGVWAVKKPFPAILTGLTIYVVMVIFKGILLPQTIFSGIIMKIIIIVFFCYGVADAKRYENNRRKTDGLKKNK